MIERNANLPSTRSKPSPSSSSHHAVTPGVGYEPVSVVGGDKHPVVGMGIIDGVPRVGGGEISGAGWCKEYGKMSVGISHQRKLVVVFLLAMYLCTSLLPNHYLKTKLLEDIGSGIQLIKEAPRRANVLFFIKLYVFRYPHRISAKSHSSSTENKSPSLPLT